MVVELAVAVVVAVVVEVDVAVTGSLVTLVTPNCQTSY